MSPCPGEIFSTSRSWFLRLPRKKVFVPQKVRFLLEGVFVCCAELLWGNPGIIFALLQKTVLYPGMKILEIVPSGTITERSVNRTDFAVELGVHIRDLRPVWSPKQVSTLFRRDGNVIVNLRNVKMVIRHDKAFIVAFDFPEIEQAFREDFPELLAHKADHERFELIALEFALSVKSAKLEARFHSLYSEIELALKSVRGNPHDLDLEKLLELKSHLSKIASSAKEAEETLLEVIQNDAEIQNLILTDNEEEIEDTTLREVESILENAIDQFENMRHDIEEVEERIDDVEKFLTFKMSAARNKIIRFDLFVSVVTLIFSLLAVIVGLYGVNLENHLESHPHAFDMLSGALVLLSLIIGVVSWRFLKRQGML